MLGLNWQFVLKQYHLPGRVRPVWNVANLENMGHSMSDYRPDYRQVISLRAQTNKTKAKAEKERK